jgi:hypothetical protein
VGEHIRLLTGSTTSSQEVSHDGNENAWR